MRMKIPSFLRKSCLRRPSRLLRHTSPTEIMTTQREKDEYEVTLSDGTVIDFDKSGEWKDVDAAMGQSLPTGFYPAAIDNYIAANYAGAGINEISKERRGYDVELVTGQDLVFNAQGEFITIDKD